MRLTILPSLFAVVLLAAACDSGGGDTLTLEEYMAALDALGTDRDYFTEFDLQPGTPVSENEAFVSAFATDTARTVQEFERLDPPPNLREAHEVLISVARSRVDFISGVETPDYLDLNTRTYGALCEIYAAADEADIDHDFNDDFYCGPDAPYFSSTSTPTPTS